MTTQRLMFIAFLGRYFTTWSPEDFELAVPMFDRKLAFDYLVGDVMHALNSSDCNGVSALNLEYNWSNKLARQIWRAVLFPAFRDLHLKRARELLQGTKP